MFGSIVVLFLVTPFTYQGLQQFSSVVFFLVFFFAFFVSIVSYIVALGGIRLMATLPLNFLPYYRDHYLGMKPIGSLGLSSAKGYFTVIALSLAITAFSSSDPSWGVFVLYGFFGGLGILGVVFFLYSMSYVHRRMVQHIDQEKARLDAELEKIANQSTRLNSSAEIAGIMVLDMMRRELSKTSRWPFDTHALVKLIVLALTSVVATLFSKLIAIILHV
jgi:hypothetical protein